jgi:cyclopropane fatty-acyl-phospholipid synthase-like methyltransferase
MSKPYAESCDQNRTPIFQVIEPLLTDRQHLLEVGSGTGQHAVYFACDLPHIQWQTSDRSENHRGIQQWLNDAPCTNIASPLALDVSTDTWPSHTYDAVFSANTLHIMHRNNVEDFFRQVPSVLNEGGLLIVYGPFNYNGHYTSESNARFDDWLKTRDAGSGIKAFEWLDQLANEGGLFLKKDYEMPANNRILCWEKNET